MFFYNFLKQSSHTNFSLSCNHSSAPFNGFRRKNKADYYYYYYSYTSYLKFFDEGHDVL